MQKFLQAKISPCLPPSAGARAALSDPPGRDTGTESQEISRCSFNWVNQVPYDVIAITPTFKLGASTCHRQEVTENKYMVKNPCAPQTYHSYFRSLLAYNKYIIRGWLNSGLEIEPLAFKIREKTPCEGIVFSRQGTTSSG